ncbi:hypothetical protein [Nostoc sp. 'Lobaria pulmonaria (5183) cyanobiont']|nr:hypothetical protein [Nostoc sp. 'Lobaria pulmonaria (5183) cyanobiont']
MNLGRLLKQGVQGKQGEKFYNLLNHPSIQQRRMVKVKLTESPDEEQFNQ